MLTPARKWARFLTILAYEGKRDLVGFVTRGVIHDIYVMEGVSFKADQGNM